MTRIFDVVFRDGSRVRLRYAPASAAPITKNGACTRSQNHLETKLQKAPKSVTQVLGRNCYPGARTHNVGSVPTRLVTVSSEQMGDTL